MNLATRVQILEQAVGFLICANTLEKGINPSVLPPPQLLVNNRADWVL